MVDVSLFNNLDDYLGNFQVSVFGSPLLAAQMASHYLDYLAKDFYAFVLLDNKEYICLFTGQYWSLKLN